MSGMAFEEIVRYREAGHIKRFHTERTVEPDTVAQHSANVALICYALYPECSKFLLLEALKHDHDEKTTGDIPAPYKRELRKMGVEFVESDVLTSFERIVLGVADIIDGSLKCLDEMEMGNMKVAHILENYLRYISQISWPKEIDRGVVSCVNGIRLRLWEKELMTAKLREIITVALNYSIGTSSQCTDGTISRGKPLSI